MVTGSSMSYVSGGDRPPPLTPVTYQPPRPKPTGLNWPTRTPTQDPHTMPTSLLTPSQEPRAAYRGQHPQVAAMVRLYLDQQLSAPQVAAELGIAPKTVRTHLKRAGVKLRDDRYGQNLPNARP